MTDKKAILDRIKTASKSKTDADLARFLGVSPAVLSNWKSRGSIDYDLILSKCEHLDLNWLLTGKEDSSNSLYSQKSQPVPVVAEPIAPYSPYSSNKGVKTPAPHSIPLIPLDAFAGYAMGNSATILDSECEHYVVPTFRNADFLIQVNGDSMHPKYQNGDIVACKKLPFDTFFQWNKVYVIDSEQGVLIKRVKPGHDDDHIMLVSENPDYAPFALHRKQISSLAIVIGLIKIE